MLSTLKGCQTCPRERSGETRMRTFNHLSPSMMSLPPMPSMTSLPPPPSRMSEASPVCMTMVSVLPATVTVVRVRWLVSAASPEMRLRFFSRSAFE
ncbi:hypothetical protein D9M69_668530 [compost metagenome]